MALGTRTDDDAVQFLATQHQVIVRVRRGDAVHRRNCAWSVTMVHEDGAVSQQFLTFYPEYFRENLYVCGSGGIDIEISEAIRLTATRSGEPFNFPQSSVTSRCEPRAPNGRAAATST